MGKKQNTVTSNGKPETKQQRLARHEVEDAAVRKAGDTVGAKSVISAIERLQKRGEW